MKRRGIAGLASGLLCACGTAGAGGIFPSPPAPVVNELFLGPGRAWVELSGTSGINLSGWGLSDGKNAYLFPKALLPSPKSYAVVDLGATALKPIAKGGRIELRDGSGAVVSGLAWGTAGGGPAILPGCCLARSAGSALLTPFATPGAANRFPEFDVDLTAPGDGEEMERSAIIAEWDFHVAQLAPAGEPSPNVEGSWTITLRDATTGETETHRAGALLDADRFVVRGVPAGSYRLRIRGSNRLGQTASDEVEVTMPEMRRETGPAAIEELTMHEGWVRYDLSAGGWWARCGGGVDPPDMTDYFFPRIAGPRSAAAERMIDGFGCPTDRTDNETEVWARTRAVWRWLHDAILREGDPGFEGARAYAGRIQGWLSIEDFGECVGRFGGIDFPAGCCCTYKAQILASLLYAAGISPDCLAMARHRYRDDPAHGARHYSAVLRLGGRWVFLDPETARTEAGLPARAGSTENYVEACDYAHPEAITVLPGSRIGGAPLVEW